MTAEPVGYHFKRTYERETLKHKFSIVLPQQETEKFDFNWLSVCFLILTRTAPNETPLDGFLLDLFRQVPAGFQFLMASELLLMPQKGNFISISPGKFHRNSKARDLKDKS